MSDVEDYMSDTLILNAQYEKKKSRIDGHRERMLAIEKRNQENTLKQTEKLSKHQLETKIRDEGLQKSIEPHNIGFKLLSKLGFQSALSDEKVENTPLITKAPLPIEILTGITGIGFDAQKKKEMEKVLEEELKANRKRASETEEMKVDFLKKRKDSNSCKMRRKDLFKSQAICFELDHRQQLVKPMKDYLWPFSKIPNEVMDETSSQVAEEEPKIYTDDEITDLLDKVIEHLRTFHKYCLYCACSLENNEEEKFCPGTTRQDHEE